MNTTSVREMAKSKRRSDILQTARKLMLASADDGFSMRALAEAAGVSSATPYNLFGSKHEILKRLLADDLASYQKALSQLPSTGVELMFDAVGLMRQFLDGQPGFYRNIMREVNADPGSGMREVAGGPRYKLWRQMLKQATTDGYLVQGFDPDALTVTLTQMIAANVREWASGHLDLTEMEARIRYGMAMLLLALATEASREAVQQRWRTAEQDLQNCWRAALSKRLQQDDLDDDARAMLVNQLQYFQSLQSANAD
ncbi:MAG: TetR/AcrR family transcriptional regulator [Pseudomonadales bacterium]